MKRNLFINISWITIFFVLDMSFRERRAIEAIQGDFDVQLILKYSFYALAGLWAIKTYIPAGVKKYMSSSSNITLMKLYVLLTLLSVIYSNNKLFTLAYSLLLIIMIFVNYYVVNQNSVGFPFSIFEFSTKILVLVYLIFILINPNAVLTQVGYQTEIRLGGFYHPNATAFILLLLYSFLIVKVFHLKSGVIDYLFLIISLVLIFLTKSRMGIFPAILITILQFFFIEKIRYNKRIIYFTIIIIASIFLYFNFSYIYDNYIFRVADPEFRNITGRTNIWALVPDMVSTSSMSLFLGNGFGASRTSLLKYIDITNFQNGFIDCIFNLGIIGLLIVINIYRLTFRRNIKLLKGNLHQYKAYLIVSLNFLIILFLNAFTELSFFSIPNAQLFVFIFLNFWLLKVEQFDLVKHEK